MQNKFITIEGIEGAGKSTAIHFIKNYLANRNIQAVFTREPGGTLLAEEIRKTLLGSLEEKVTPETELFLMFAARTQHLQHCIIPALYGGKWVVSDRFIDASYAYQGGGRGIPMHYISTLDKWIVKDIYPQLTLLLDIPPDIGNLRLNQSEKVRDRIEEEDVFFFERVRNAYLMRAKEDKDRIKIVNATQSIADVEKQIEMILNAFIKDI